MAPVSKPNNNFKEAGKIKLKVFKENDFTSTTYVGEGGFGAVFKASAEGYPEIAVKTMLTGNISKGIKEMMVEVKNMVQHTHHPNMVTLYGTVVDDERRDIGLVMEWMEGGCLHNVIKEDVPYTLRLVYKWFLGAANGLNYLHEQGVVHRDVKPPNMLLSKDKETIKICDLGLSKAAILMSRTSSGTFWYMAPELLLLTQPTSAIDVYALAISWWQMLTRRVPYDHATPVQQMNLRGLIAREDFRPEINLRYKEDTTMIQRMWHTDPEQRPTMKEVMRFAQRKAEANSNNKTYVKRKNLDSEMGELSVSDAASSNKSSDSSNSSSKSKAANPRLDNWLTSTASVCEWIEKSTLSGEMAKISKTSEDIEKEVVKISNMRKTETVTSGLEKVKKWMNYLLKVIHDALIVNPGLKLLVDYETNCVELMASVEEQAKKKIEKIQNNLSKKK